jgi:hypothetical protein
MILYRGYNDSDFKKLSPTKTCLLHRQKYTMRLKRLLKYPYSIVSNNKLSSNTTTNLGKTTVLLMNLFKLDIYPSDGQLTYDLHHK